MLEVRDHVDNLENSAVNLAMHLAEGGCCLCGSYAYGRRKTAKVKAARAQCVAKLMDIVKHSAERIRELSSKR